MQPRHLPWPTSPVDFADKLSIFSEHWSPRWSLALNDYEVKVVKIKGEFE